MHAISVGLWRLAQGTGQERLLRIFPNLVLLLAQPLGRLLLAKALSARNAVLHLLQLGPSSDSRRHLFGVRGRRAEALHVRWVHCESLPLVRLLRHVLRLCLHFGVQRALLESRRSLHGERTTAVCSLLLTAIMRLRAGSRALSPGAHDEGRRAVHRGRRRLLFNVHVLLLLHIVQAFAAIDLLQQVVVD